jgi:hypothetical protein
MTEVDQEVNTVTEGLRMVARWPQVSVGLPSYWEGTDEALGGMMGLARPFQAVSLL